MAAIGKVNIAEYVRNHPFGHSQVSFVAKRKKDSKMRSQSKSAKPKPPSESPK